jgi:uncharacterized protein
MEYLGRLVIKFRIQILVVVGLVTVGLGSMLPSLYPDDDVMQFLPADDPEIKLFRRVNQRFGGLDVAIVGLESENLFTPERLAKVRQLTRRISEIDGVFDILSFTEVPDPRPGMGGLEVTPLVGRVPVDETELAELKERVLKNRNAVGNLISEDGQAAMILCFLGGKRLPIYVAEDIKKEALALWNGDGLFFGGAPFIRLHVAGGTQRDLVRLTPYVALVVMFVTFLIFRRPLGVLLSLGVLFVSLIWLMGLLALRGKGITVVGSALPTLLVAIGGAYGIHILAAYFSGQALTVHDRIIETYREVGAPVLASALTTCTGFLSFLVMDMEPMREFGAAAAVGVGISGILALVVIPALLSFSREVPDKLGTALLGKPLGRIGGWAEQHRYTALIGALVLMLCGAVGVARIAPDATLSSFFKEGSEPDEANKFLERHFGGSVYLQIYFEGDMRSPFVLAEMRKLVEYVRGIDEVVQVSSIIDPLVMMSEAMGGRADLPIDRGRTRSLYPFLEGTAAIDQIISSEKDAGLIQIRTKNVGPARMNQIIADLEQFVENEIPHGVKAVSLRELDGSTRTRREGQMYVAIAKRIGRLITMYDSKAGRNVDTSKIVGILTQDGVSKTLVPGADLDQAVKSVIEEHLVGEAAPFEEPIDDVPEEVALEWSQRGDLASLEINAVVGKGATIAAVENALRRALPLTSGRDPEGLELTAEAVAAGLIMARAEVRAQRLTAPVLTAAGVDAPPIELSRRVTWALTDLEAPYFGFPDNSEEASRVIASVTGQPVINVALCNSTIRNQLKSLVVAFILLLAILSFTFRSIVSAFKALVPTIFMLAVSVGIMGAINIPLDLTTSMIAAIALGIGVDYAIHFLWRRRKRGESLSETTAHVGPAIASNAVQVAAGFAVLALSDMVPMQRFGMLVAMTMVVSAVATFVLLPATRAEGKLSESAQETNPATKNFRSCE